MGEYSDGQLHGEGVLVYQEGDVYEGEWVHNVKTGEMFVCVLCVSIDGLLAQGLGVTNGFLEIPTLACGKRIEERAW